jgi:hypothetical protein
MSDPVTNEYLMNIIKENVGMPVHDSNMKGAFASNGATNVLPGSIATPQTAMMNQATLRPQGAAAATIAQNAAAQGEEEEGRQEGGCRA